MVVRNQDWKPREGDRIALDRDGLEKIRERLGPGWPDNTTSGEKKGESTEVTIPTQSVEEISTPGDTAEAPQDGVASSVLIPTRLAVENIFTVTDYRSPFSFESHLERDQHNFHGNAWLPEGYSWANVDEEAVIKWTESPTGSDNMKHGLPGLSSNYNWVQSVLAIFQVGSAAFTLYKSRGHQIDRYGYAAFGLTVVPYLIMSILNLVAQTVTASYPNVYMVGNPEMDEARRRGGVFDGVVGQLARDGKTDNPVYEIKPTEDHEEIKVMERVSDSNSYPRTIRLARPELRDEFVGHLQATAHTRYELYSVKTNRYSLWLFRYLLLPILVGSLSLVVVGAMTQFKEGESTKAQRGWTLSWLVVGIACGWWADLMTLVLIPDHNAKTGKMEKSLYIFLQIPLAIALLGLFCVPAIGGFVTVAGMLWEYGICEAS